MNNQDKTISYVEFPAQSIDELKQAVTFYKNTFGWDYQQWGEDYADTQSSGVGSGISADNPPTSVLPVVYLKDLDDMLNQVTANGGEITKGIFDFPGGRRFHFKDPAGNELAVWSE